MKHIPWIIIILICTISAWVCVVNKNANIAADAAYKALQERFDDTEKRYSEYVSWSGSAFNDATAHAVQAEETARQSKKSLNQERRRVKSLLKLLDSAEKETPDSSWVQVNPNYKLGCDSLRNIAQTLNTLVDQYEQDNQAHVDALNYETLIRDSALQKEREFSNSFRAQLVYCIGALGKSGKSKTKTQLYAGMAAWGNKLNPLGGGEINLGFKTKNNQFYEIKGAYINGWWVGIGTKYLISLK